MARRESGDKVVFCSAVGPLCRKGAVILRAGVLEREGDKAKKGSKVTRSFVVDLKVSERVRERLKESDDGRKGRE